MRTRRLGKTGLVVSELSLGTWGLSGDGYRDTEAWESAPVWDEAAAEAVVRRAIDMGVNLVDTADAYGAGHMEALLGRVLADHPHVFVVTKGGVDRSTDPPRKRFDPDYLRVAVQRSCKRLGRERLDVFLLHHPSAACLRRGEATDALLALKAEGLIGHWGVAVTNADMALAALERRTEVLEMPHNLLHPSDLHRISGDVMVEGAGILARSVLAYGLLAGQWHPGHTFAPGDHRAERWSRLDLDKRLEQLDALRFLVRGDVRTLRGAAVRFVLSNPHVSSAVLGPRTLTQLEQLVRETGSGPRYLPNEDLRALPDTLDTLGLLP